MNKWAMEAREWRRGNGGEGMEARQWRRGNGGEGIGIRFFCEKIKLTINN